MMPPMLNAPSAQVDLIIIIILVHMYVSSPFIVFSILNSRFSFLVSRFPSELHCICICSCIACCIDTNWFYTSLHLNYYSSIFSINELCPSPMISSPRTYHMLEYARVCPTLLPFLPRSRVFSPPRVKTAPSVRLYR